MGACGQGTGPVARIPGMAIRPAGWAGLEAAVGLLGGQNRTALGSAGVRVGHLRSEWELPGSALGEDNILAEEGSRDLGYAALSTRGELAVAAADDALAAEPLERVVARVRDRGDASLLVTVLSANSVLSHLAARHPFPLEHETLLMWRPLGAPLEERPAPDGVSIRTFRPGDAEPVHSLFDEAYGGWDPLYVPVRSTTGSIG